MNHPAVEKTKVAYKVNANGNLQVESEANKKAKDVVSDLNSQLVDLYLASILSNLYTAQKNVETVANAQGKNINQFESKLYPVSTAFPTTLPSLVSLSNSAAQSNSNLVSSLSAYSTMYEGLQSGQTDFGKNLTALIEQRSTDGLSYTAFVSALMDMEQETLSEQTTKMIEQLTIQQQALTEGIGNSADPARNTLATGYVQTVTTVDGQITELLKRMEDSKARLKAKTAEIDALAETILKDYYPNKANLDEIRVRDMLSDSSFKVLASDYNNQVNQLMIQSLNQLPTLNPTTLSSQLNLSGERAKEIQFNSDLASRYQASYTANASLKNRLDTAYTNLQIAMTAKSSPAPAPKEAEITVSNPTGLTLLSWKVVDETAGTSSTLAPAETVKIDLSHAYHFEFQFELPTVATPAPKVDNTDTPKDDNSPKPASSVSVMTIQGKPIATTPTTVEEDYRKASVEYVKVVQEVIDAYNHAGRMLSTYHPNGSASNLTDNFLNQSAKTYLLTTIKKGITGSLGAYEQEVDNDIQLTKAVEDLKKNKDTLMTELTKIQNTNANVSKEIDGAVALVTSLKQRSAELQKLENQYSQGNTKTDSSLSSLNSSLQGLMTTTQGVADNSKANTKQAESLSATFESFNKAAEDAKTSADNLSSEADQLLTNFKDEMEKTQNFATSFETVFANAYKDGVPNEALLEFMSNPVVSEASSVKKTANAYRPFTWILLLEIVTFFTAYLFATHNLVKKIEDRFKTNRWDATDILNVSVLTVLAVGIGLVLGIISGQQLHVERGSLPSWVVLIVLFSLVLVQGQYFLLKNFKSIGMGVILYMMISFVYLSSAIGTTATLKGLPATLKSLNILSLLENQLFAYFDGYTASVGILATLFAAIIALILVNIFVNIPIFLEKRKGEGTHV